MSTEVEPGPRVPQRNLGVVGPTEKLEEVTFFIINESFQVLSFHFIDHSKVLNVRAVCLKAVPVTGCLPVPGQTETVHWS